MQSIDAQAILADLHAHEMDYQAVAATEFEAILKADPRNMPAHRGLGYIALHKHDLASAAQHFKEAIALDDKDAQLLYYAALLLELRPDENNMHRSDPAMMETYLVGATNLDADFAEAWNLLAYARMRQDKFDQAIQAAYTAVKLKPRDENYQQQLANLYVAARQWDNAIYVFTALKSSQNENISQNASEMLGQIEQAKQGGPKIALRMAPGPDRSAAPTPEEQVIDHGSANGANTAPAKPDMRPVKFMKATLAGVSCDGKTAVLNLALAAAPSKGGKVTRVRLVKMLVPDIQQVVLVGVDTFSCDWRNQKVALNYKEGPSPNMVANAAAYDGDVVSIEMH